MLRLCFSAAAPIEWARLRRASHKLRAASEFAAAGPHTLDFHDRRAAAREQNKQKTWATSIRFVWPPLWIRLPRVHRELGPLANGALRMSPVHVTMETDGERPAQIVRSSPWRHSLLSLTLVVPLGTRHLSLRRLTDLQARLKKLAAMSSPDSAYKHHDVRKTLETLPRLPELTHFECDGLVPTARELANLARAFPALQDARRSAS